MDGKRGEKIGKYVVMIMVTTMAMVPMSCKTLVIKFY
jgi:hypothetical protein